MISEKGSILVSCMGWVDHRDLTDLRYMHLAKGHEEQATRPLDHRGDAANEPNRGGGVEAER